MKFIKNSIIFVISFSILSFIFSFYLYHSGIISPSDSELKEDYGIVRRANFSKIALNEGFGIFSYNNIHSRGPNFINDSNSSNILFFGDSMLEGEQVFERDHLRSVIEKRLTSSNINSQVLNYGRSGFNLPYMYTYYNHWKNITNPAVTLFLIGKDDLKTNNYKDFMPTCNLINEEISIKTFKENKKLQIYRFIEPVLKNFSYLEMLRNCYYIRNDTKTILFDKFAQKNNKLTKIKSIEENRDFLIEPLTKKIFSTFSEKDDIIIVIKPNTNDSFNDFFIKYLIKNKINYIDLNELEIPDSFTYWKATSKSGHWNQQAHKAIGDFIGTKLLGKLNL